MSDEDVEILTPERSELGDVRFYDEGRYEIVDNQTKDVESGSYIVSTVIADEIGGGKVWETRFYMIKDGVEPFGPDDEGYNDVDEAYREGGSVLTLWKQSKDPKGKKAKQVHDLFVSSAEKGLPAGEVEEICRVFSYKLEYGEPESEPKRKLQSEV